ncbi:alanine racemase [Vagococcus sp.]|uniref:alanine racemase n=1 Tax=Vagococcus sp. TaxID=1933889 RepID=UPI003F986063
MQQVYPRLVVNLDKLKNNVETLRKKAEKKAVTISGVIKGVNALPEIIDTFIEGGLRSLSSSRLSQIELVKSMYPEVDTLMLRIPMLSELERMVQCCDTSLNTEISTLKALNKICQKLNIKHSVILMVDLGDLREGFFEKEHLFEAALLVEQELDTLYLKGIGTNLGCYGSIEPDVTNLKQLVTWAREIENEINRPLDIVSGGASTTVPLLLNDTLPEGINHLRIGDNIFLRDMEPYFNYTFPEMHGDVFTIEAEIIEIKEKPSHPIGNITVDAFGNKAEYEDIGDHTRALLAIGRQDLGDITKLIPYDPNILLVGGSSDHTIIDITDCDKKYQIGDILSFNIEYELLLYSTGSPYVFKKFIKEGN